MVTFMTKNIEIEFKTVIQKENYEMLLQKFHLENNIFKQINHYFDTDDFSLNQKQMVLRIRQKGEYRFKVTLKCQGLQGAFESHVIISKEQADDMIQNGFNTKEFFEEIDYFVHFRASIENYRVSTPYLGGILFLDRCIYCGTEDYEIEYEVNNYDEGKLIFETFLEEHDIELLPTRRKSERAFLCKR
jgi:uncharacterized protein YjbK